MVAVAAGKKKRPAVGGETAVSAEGKVGAAGGDPEEM